MRTQNYRLKANGVLAFAICENDKGLANSKGHF